MAVVCCDTSFLFSLYGNDDDFSIQAVMFSDHLRHPISVSLFNDFEFENSVRVSVFRKMTDPDTATTMLANYATDKRRGKIDLIMCDLSEVLAQAKGLSLAHSERGGHRAYDILHVASALRLGATEFLSFDGNQRKLAKAVGLKVRPV